MDPAAINKLRSLTTFEALVDYLRDELDWPIEAEDAEKVAFEYNPQELGIDPRHAVKIEAIRQIRPLADRQPWGVFYVEFESKQLPVVVLRRILQTLVPASRRHDPDRPAWQMSDLLFISSQGAAADRSISFAHFRQTPEGKHELRTFSWDVHETHLYYIKNLNLAALRWPQNPADAAAWRNQWGAAFTVPHRYVPTTAQMLAEEMARIARQVRGAVQELYGLEHVGGPLHQLHLGLKMTLITDLTPDDFADMYAQTVTYGLFAARATRHGRFAAADTSALIEHTNPFLRELLQQLIDQEAVDLEGLGVSELTDLLRRVDMEAIMQDFGRQKRGEDPVIHFYETFMRQYDPVQKTKRGEFYTPDAVVSFIVRSVDHLLKTEFGYPDGLADSGLTRWKGADVPRVQILDPATGTGTFLKYVIEVIWETFYANNKKLSAADRRVKWNQFVRQTVLPRLFGFELKMSPYTIAHMKVGLALQEKGFDFAEGERLRIYLSNTLQPAHEVPRVDTPALAHEVQQANEVKADIPITVVIGNPPYSNFGMMNKGKWILELLEEYKKGLKEKKLNLDDDFIKFLRFGQWQIDQSGKGILALITNNTFIDGITHRRLRESMMSSFDDIYILDLHGSSMKNEVSPDGSKDDNVFDIQQGVAISIFVRKPRKEKTQVGKIHYAEIWGAREKKYEKLLLANVSNIQWTDLSDVDRETCLGTFRFFAPKGFNNIDEYCRFWKLTDIFMDYVSGIQTGRDEFVSTMTENEMQERLNTISNSTSFEKGFQYINTPDWRGFNYSQYRSLCIDNTPNDLISWWLYRPFDVRPIIYNKHVIKRMRGFLMEGMLKNNLALISVRQLAGDEFSHVFVTNKLIDGNTISLETREYNYLFPLFGKIKELTQISFLEITSSLNLSGRFLKKIEADLKLKFSETRSDEIKNAFSSKDVLHYLYAALHSPTYRRRYAEFLKIDFPRLPLTSNLELFRELCRLGSQLVPLHLLESPALEKFNTRFVGAGDGAVAKGFPKYSDETVWINLGQGFQGVPQAVWEFHIGGYQVCHKWLKDRRGRQLSAEDILHYQKIVVALSETIRLMQEIDVAIEEHGGWPIQ